MRHDDLRLLRDGGHPRPWDVLGAHIGGSDDGARSDDSGGEPGVTFAVWAPRATAVSVRVPGRPDTPLRRLGGGGIWEEFVPGLGAGTAYQYWVKGFDGRWRGKADPMARATPGPAEAWSVVAEPGRHRWRDEAWMARRAEVDARTAPMSVYEVHLGSWRPGLGYRDLARELTDHVRAAGFTHVEFLPIAEHPYGGSWGYQVTSYYAPTSRFGSADDLRHLVDTLHNAGIGVILDWVPGHFAADEWALGRFDGLPLYEHADPVRGTRPSWGTLVFDYANPQVANFLIGSALYWLDEFHIDGLRVDAVSSMLHLDFDSAAWRPNEYGGSDNLDAVAFLRRFNEIVHERYPDVVTIAEDTSSSPGLTASAADGGLGFDFTWNLAWTGDTLTHFAGHPDQRAHADGMIARRLERAFDEAYVLPLSHDEVSPGNRSLWQRVPDGGDQAGHLTALLTLMWATPGKKLLFMGSEIGQPDEWKEWESVPYHLVAADRDTPHRRIADHVARLNRLYRELPALYAHDRDPGAYARVGDVTPGTGVTAFARGASGSPTVVCVANLGPTGFAEYRIGLPWPGTWQAPLTGQEVTAVTQPWQGMPASAVLRLAAPDAVWLLSTGTPPAD
jgi:1,4-alpha-glucan branching enzyme